MITSETKMNERIQKNGYLACFCEQSNDNIEDFDPYTVSDTF